MTHKEKKNEETNTTEYLKTQNPKLLADVDFYESIIDDPEVSEDRKRELIEVIVSIVVAFIDIGFGVHPVQLAQAETARAPVKIIKAIMEGVPERSEA